MYSKKRLQLMVMMGDTPAKVIVHIENTRIKW